MKAIVCAKYGASSDLQFVEVAKPVPKSNEVLIRIYATAVNDYDTALVRVLTNHLTIHAVKRSHLLHAYFTTSGNVRLVDVTTNRNIA